MARPGAEAIQATIKRAQQPIEPPPTKMSDRAMELYREVMGSLSPGARASAVHRAMAGNIALALEEVELCTALIDREGPVVASPQGLKANPAVGVRDSASKRVAALASRLRALPAVDSREAARAIKHQQAHRTVAPILRADPAPNAEPVDWVALAKQELGE